LWYDTEPGFDSFTGSSADGKTWAQVPFGVTGYAVADKTGGSCLDMRAISGWTRPPTCRPYRRDIVALALHDRTQLPRRGVYVDEVRAIRLQMSSMTAERLTRHRFQAVGGSPAPLGGAMTAGVDRDPDLPPGSRIGSGAICPHSAENS